MSEKQALRPPLTYQRDGYGFYRIRAGHAGHILYSQIAEGVKDEPTAKLLVAAVSAMLRLAERLDYDAVELAEHLASAQPGWILNQLADAFREKEGTP